MEAKKLRQKSISALRVHLIDLLKKQFDLRMQRGSGQSLNPHLFSQVRRAIARVKTVIHEVERKNG